MSGIAAISQQIWDMKYRLKSPDGTAVDKTIEDSWLRVATALAEAENEPDNWVQPFFDALDGFKFLPAGRILAGAGTGRTVTLFNCFVMGTIEDDLAGIFKHLREAALTMQQGGGIGYDFSTIRPKGALVRGVGADASGPLSFMDVWDSMCRTIMSAGARRGAMMATLRCDHPDVIDFIEAKREPGRLRNFNLSVLVTDAFMEAVKADKPWDLVFNGKVYKTVSAVELWDRIMQATYAYAEPGVIFIDRINQTNNLRDVESISATNPCGEQPLPPYGACLLGSINLATLVVDAFTDTARLDLEQLRKLTATAVRMMDNVVDCSRFPLEAQEAEAKAKRRIGLGVTGLADALIMCRARYGSEQAVALTGEWLRLVANEAYRASALIAAEKGAFPLFNAESYLASPIVQRLDDDVRALIAEHGIRNALLTSIAPTGTISLFADNVSSGIEPVFSYRYERKVLMPDGSRRVEEVSDHAYRAFRAKFGDDVELPDYFVDAQSLEPVDHVVMQAAAQRWIDSSISKTINCPEDLPFETFKNVYEQAYALGCKGCTTYRPNAITGSVLSVTEKPAETPAPVEKPKETTPAETVVYMTKPLARPEALPGETYKVRWPDSDHAMYITINDIIEAGRRRPFEVFINSKNMEHYAWTVALTRMISAVFRRGGDISFVVEELKAVFDPRGGAWMEGRYVPSLLAAIGGVIERHMKAIGMLPGGERPLSAVAAADNSIIEEVGHECGSDCNHDHGGSASANDARPAAKSGKSRQAQCPRCGQFGLIRQEGCDTCLECGYSKCSG